MEIQYKISMTLYVKSIHIGVRKLRTSLITTNIPAKYAALSYFNAY